MRILVIDDEASVCLALKMMLARDRNEATCVTSGLEALQLLAQESFDVAIVDWMLPDIAGPDSLSGLRSLAPAMKVCVMSGLEPDAIRAVTESDPPDAVLRKPFSMDALLSAVAGLGTQ